MPRLRRTSDDLLRTYPEFSFSPYAGLSGGYVAETLATVLHFLYATRSFEECLVAVVNQGGDADTTGAIAGALAGAYYGPGDIPRRWLRALDPRVREEVEWLGTRLVDLSPLGAGEEPDLGPSPR
jgi:ADP-ribosyl-[dinitrogen reductase] hydrolase